MLTETLIKLLVTSIVMVGLLRLVVVVFIGDTENDLAILRLIHSARRARSRDPEQLARK